MKIARSGGNSESRTSHAKKTKEFALRPRGFDPQSVQPGNTAALRFGAAAGQLGRAGGVDGRAAFHDPRSRGRTGDPWRPQGLRRVVALASGRPSLRGERVAFGLAMGAD